MKNPGGAFQEKYGAYQNLVSFSDRDVFVIRMQASVKTRRQLRKWLELGDRLTRRFVLAAGRTLAENGPRIDDLSVYFYKNAVKWCRPFLLRAFSLLGLPAALGRPPGHPMQRLLPVSWSRSGVIA
jgi:hypothetical protein